MEGIQIWHITRASGMVAYILLTVTVIVGLYVQILRQKGASMGIYPVLHESSGHWAMYLTLFHTVILLFDSYVNLAWYDIFVPFISTYHTFSLGLGIIGLYGLVLIFLTTDFRSFFPVSFRRTVHMLSPVMYVLATFHGIFLGTDTAYTSIQAGYILSATFCGVLLTYRFTLLKPSIPLDKG